MYIYTTPAKVHSETALAAMLLASHATPPTHFPPFPSSSPIFYGLVCVHYQGSTESSKQTSHFLRVHLIGGGSEPNLMTRPDNAYCIIISTGHMTYMHRPEVSKLWEMEWNRMYATNSEFTRCENLRVFDRIDAVCKHHNLFQLNKLPPPSLP